MTCSWLKKWSIQSKKTCGLKLLVGNINVAAAHIYREKKSWNKRESVFINMPSKCYTLQAKWWSKSICFLLQHCPNSSNKFLCLNQEKKSTWHLHTGNYTRRNRSDGGQSPAVNSGMCNPSSIIRRLFVNYWDTACNAHATWRKLSKFDVIICQHNLTVLSLFSSSNFSNGYLWCIASMVFLSCLQLTLYHDLQACACNLPNFGTLCKVNLYMG